MPKRFDTPWMNKETLAAIILKRRLWKKYKYCRNQRNIERYEEAKRRSKYLVRGAKEEYERSIALNMKVDNKIFCKYIQSKTKNKENIPCIMDENGEIHTDDKEKVELLNNSKVCLLMRTLTQGIPPFPTRTIHNLEIVKFDSKNIH